jgi:hypothetical protein
MRKTNVLLYGEGEAIQIGHTLDCFVPRNDDRNPLNLRQFELHPFYESAFHVLANPENEAIRSEHPGLLRTSQ